MTPLACSILLSSGLTSWSTAGDDTQYHIEDYSGSGDIVIAFLGSNSDVDWKNNFRFWKTPYKNMETKFYVHAGFLKCWKLIEDTIGAELSKYNISSITITGHSYGGALAILCKEYIWYHYPELRDNTRLITFGAPRVIGLHNWTKIKDRWNNSTLLMNGSDFITRIPFRCMFYRHVAKIIHLGDEIRLWKYFDFKYHWIENYCDSIRRIST